MEGKKRLHRGRREGKKKRGVHITRVQQMMIHDITTLPLPTSRQHSSNDTMPLHPVAYQSPLIVPTISPLHPTLVVGDMHGLMLPKGHRKLFRPYERCRAKVGGRCRGYGFGRIRW